MASRHQAIRVKYEIAIEPAIKYICLTIMMQSSLFYIFYFCFKRKLNCAIGKKLFLRLAKYIQNYNLIIGLKIIISNFFYRAKAMFCFTRYALQSRLSIDIFSY